MPKVIGYYQQDRVICPPCANEQGEEATKEALPEGFTCDECWEVFNA